MKTRQGFKLLVILCTLFTVLPMRANELIDPTRPANKHKIKSSDHVGAVHRGWTLESTLVAPNRRVAVINGKLLSEGESVEGAIIIKIGKLEVLIQTPSRRMTLQLLPDIVKIQPEDKD